MKTVMTLSSAVTLAAAVLHAEAPAIPGSACPDAVAALVAGKPITLAQVDAAVASRLVSIRAQEYTLRREALDRLIASALLAEEARRRGVTVEAMLSAEAGGTASPVRDEEVRAVYDSARDRFADVAEEEALRRIKESMERSRSTQRRQDLVPELRKKLKAQVFLEAPRANVSADDDPSLGPAQAPVTIVEFSDFQCPYCARAVPVIREVRERYKDRVRIVFRDFPLSMHKRAAPAAEAATCAQQQGRFWQMHDRLFTLQPGLEAAAISKAAIETGLDPAAFEECLKSGRSTAEWRKDMEDGRSYGVTGTPTFFVNGRVLAGAVSLESLSRVIEEELERTVPVTGTK